MRTFQLTSDPMIVIRDDGLRCRTDLSSYQEFLADGGTPFPSAVAAPSSVTMRQARLALLDAGLLVTVNAAISAMTGPEGEAARIEWEYSQEVQRHRGLVSSLGAALGLTEVQLDGLFIAAAAIL